MRLSIGAKIASGFGLALSILITIGVFSYHSDGRRTPRTPCPATSETELMSALCGGGLGFV